MSNRDTQVTAISNAAHNYCKDKMHKVKKQKALKRIPQSATNNLGRKKN